MSDTPPVVPPAAGPDAQNAPRLSVLTQYVKDLSFENPRAPQGTAQEGGRPEIQVSVDIKAQQMAEGQFEIVLDVTLNARSGETAVFVLECSYGGVFVVANIPAESLQALLLIECPRILFPFLRRIVADVTRDGGFPPLMLDPIDFVALYRHRMMQQQQAEQQGLVGNA